MNKIYWIENKDHIQSSGQLAIVARPRGNEWLSEDLQSLHDAKVNVLVSFLETHEQIELGLHSEHPLAHTIGIEYKNFPITDRQIPESMIETQKFVQLLAQLLSEGKNIGLHCRQSVGRSGFMSAAILVEKGYSVRDAFQCVEQARGCAVPDTEAQRQWVEKYARVKDTMQNFAFAF